MKQFISYSECRQTPSFLTSGFLHPFLKKKNWSFNPILSIIDNNIEFVSDFSLTFSFFNAIFFIFWAAQISHV